MNLLTKLMLVLMISATSVLAQDTTCNSGDIQWVKETVDASEAVTGGSNSAEYNNYSAPFGIQGAFDETCAGAIIRIVVGANEYNSSSASWNGRDSTNKTINVDTVDGDITTEAQIEIVGYIDETTPCTAFTSTCPVMLDFEKDVITGSDGFQFASGKEGYLTKWIGVRDTDGYCFDVPTTRIFFYAIRCTGAATDGFRFTANGSWLVDSHLYDNGDDQLLLTSANTAMGNFIECDTGGSPAAGQLGLSGSNNSLYYRNTIKNCDRNYYAISTGSLVAANTADAGTLTCLEIGNSARLVAVIDNLLYNCTDDAARRGDGQNQYWSNNLYDPGTGNQIYHNPSLMNNATLYDPQDASNDNAPDFVSLACSVVDAGTDDYTMSSCGYTYIPVIGANVSSPYGVYGSAYSITGGAGGEKVSATVF